MNKQKTGTDIYAGTKPEFITDKKEKLANEIAFIMEKNFPNIHEGSQNLKDAANTLINAIVADNLDF